MTTKPKAPDLPKAAHTELRPRSGGTPDTASSDATAPKPAPRSKIDLVTETDGDDLFNDMPV